MMVEHIILWILDGFMLASTIISVMLRKKTKRILKALEDSNEDRWKKLNDFVKTANDRIDLLSKENNKLREENDMLKERLRNIGITDFDVMP